MSGPDFVEGNGNRVTWFDPPPGDHPVEGNTIYIRPEGPHSPAGYVPAEVYLSVLNELTDLRAKRDRQPRVFLADDIVPGGIWVMAPNYFLQRNLKRYRAATDLVEVFDVPEFEARVAEEKARRAGEEGAG